MYIQQLYTNCLAHAAYYIENGGEAAVIDPLRDHKTYLDLAHSRGAKIRYVFETHFHADFVSGHIDLANKTGAEIIFGPGAEAGYKIRVAEDGELLPLGKAGIKVLHTPGHTVESSCFLLLDETGREVAVFTGDTLFVNEVGRPDLLSGNKSKEELAAMLFDSLNNKLKTLPGNVIVYPGHGPGSACGKNIGAAKFSTIAEEVAHNYALLETDKDRFIQSVTSDLPTPPGYFFKDAAINKNGVSALDDVIASNMVALTPEVVNKLVHEGFNVLDTRAAEKFAMGFIPGSLNIGLNGDFAVWVGTLLSIELPLILVCEPGKEEEAVTRLARIGFDNVTGYLEGGINAWADAMLPLDNITTVATAQCGDIMNDATFGILDVRNRREVAKCRIPGSIHIPLNELGQRIHELNKNLNWMVYCAGGYRSMIASSLLKKNEFHHLHSLEGGINTLVNITPELTEVQLEEQE